MMVLLAAGRTLSIGCGAPAARDPVWPTAHTCVTALSERLP
jgi:hypothetical protein